jgi:hypothetical protein
MPRYFDLQHTVLVVVGHGILPEEEDRPLAYDLKREITTRANGSDLRTAVVVTDVWLTNQELGDFFPAITIGGPAVNAFTEQIYADLPIIIARDQEVFVMADEGKRAALWGMDQESTKEAVGTFSREGLLDRFPQLVWRA